jgi:hypothetical protein
MTTPGTRGAFISIDVERLPLKIVAIQSRNGSASFVAFHIDRSPQVPQFTSRIRVYVLEDCVRKH